MATLLDIIEARPRSTNEFVRTKLHENQYLARVIFENVDRTYLLEGDDDYVVILSHQDHEFKSSPSPHGTVRIPEGYFTAQVELGNTDRTYLLRGEKFDTAAEIVGYSDLAILAGGRTFYAGNDIAGGTLMPFSNLRDAFSAFSAFRTFSPRDS